MNVMDFMIGLWTDPEQQAAFEEDPEGYTEANLDDGVTQEDFFEALPDAVGALPPQEAQAVADSYGMEQTAGGYNWGASGPPVSEGDTPASDFIADQAMNIEVVTNNVLVDNSDNRIYDQSSEANVVAGPGSQVAVDQSGDNLNLDEGAAAVTGDGNQVQTGDGVMAGGDVDGEVTVGDGNVTGDGNTVGDGNVASEGDAIVGAEGPVNTGEITGSTLGDGNTSLHAGGDVSSPIAFGNGDAVDGSTSIDAGGDIGAVGDGNTQVDGTSGNVNLGGDQGVEEVNAGDIGGAANFGGGQIGNDSAYDISAEGDAHLAGGDQAVGVDSSAESLNWDSSVSGTGNSTVTDDSTFDSHNESFSADGSFNTYEGDLSTSGSYNDMFEAEGSYGSSYNSADSYESTYQESSTDSSTESSTEADITDLG